MSYLVNPYKVSTPVAPSQLLTEFAEYGTISTTNDTDDTFTSTTGSTWSHLVSGIAAEFAEGSYDDTAGSSDEGAMLGLTDVQGTYCDGFEPYACWNIAGTGQTATGCQSVSSCGIAVTSAISVNTTTRFRIVKTSSNIKYYYDLNASGSWTLAGTYTATIPTLYLMVGIKVTGHTAIWSSVQ